MDRRGFFRFGLAVMAAGAAPFFALADDDHDDDDHGRRGWWHGRDRHDEDWDDDDEDDDDERRWRFRRYRYFRSNDYGLLTRYYSGPWDLPPGLRRKYYRTGALPRGWERRIRPFPPEVIEILPPLPPDYDCGYLDGYGIIYDRRTRVILDAVDLLNALTGR